MPHVGAMRLRELAKALVRQGHQIILLTATLSNETPQTLSKIAADFATHDWVSPFYLAVAPVSTVGLRCLRSAKTPVWLRKCVVCFYYFFFQGVFRDWFLGLQPYRTFLKSFKPDFIYATFGNTDALNIAKQLSDDCRCEWILDVKDPWSVFIPFGFRHYLARFYQSASRLTALSPEHATEAKHWFSQDISVVHSGFSEKLLFRENLKLENDFLNVVLVGSLYQSAILNQLMLALNQLVPLNIFNGIKLQYVGNDEALFLRHTQQLDNTVSFVNHGFLEFDAYLTIVSQATVNVFVYQPRVYCHHKIYELQAVGRPTLCLGENVPPELSDCSADVAGIVSFLKSLKTLSTHFFLQYHEKIKGLTWEKQAQRLIEGMCS